MHLILHLQQQHLASLDALDLNLLLLSILQIQRRHVLELEFLRHDTCCAANLAVSCGTELQLE